MEGDREGEAVRAVQPDDYAWLDSAFGQCAREGVNKSLEFPVGGLRSRGVVRDGDATKVFFGDVAEKYVVDCAVRDVDFLLWALDRHGFTPCNRGLCLRM